MRAKTLPLVLTLGGVLACGALAALSVAASSNAGAPTAATPRAPAPPPPIPYGQAPNYRAIVAQNRAAVVGITTESTRASQVDDSDSEDDNDDQDAPGAPDSPFGNDPFFRYFFGRPTPGRPDNTPVQAQGSGFIIRANGIVLTNAHVVRGARQVTVKLADHREFQAKVLGLDTTTDVAVVKIDAHDLPVVRIGDPDGLAVGDYVLAIGAPFGLEESATAGIVSAKGRALESDNAVSFIQTDVAVNPGNSGGPLFDATGAVVGINSQIYSRTGGYEGIAFAIPIDVAQNVADQIIRTGKVEHARLGVFIQPVDQSLARSFGLETPSGALVSKVEPDSAAAHAGLKAGDVILRYNGKPVADSVQLSSAVRMAKPGDAAGLEVWRAGKSLSLNARLDAEPGSGARVASNGGGPVAPGAGRLGLTVRALTAAERNQAGTDTGVLVERASGAAARAGIQRGDVVLAVDGTPVNSAEQLRGLLEKRNTVALLVQHGDRRVFVPVQLG